MEHCKTGELTKDCLVSTYHDVFTSPVKSLPGDVHFELDITVAPIQCAPTNVPVALKTAVMAQLDQYEEDGHLTTVTQPTDWISNLVMVKRPDKLKLCIDPKPLDRALKRSHYLMPTSDDMLYKLPKAVGCRDTEEEAIRDHDVNLIALTERCREVKLRVSLKKLQFRTREVRFHGHILLAEGLKADPKKVTTVLIMPNPTDTKGVQRCVGFLNYLSRFMPRLSELCEPLRRLLDKYVPWRWLPKNYAAMKEIKTLVTAVPVLR